MTTARVSEAEGPGLFEADVVVYPPAWRAAAAGLRVFARGSLLAVLAALLLSENPPSNPLKQMRLFLGLFAAPELAAWCIMRAFASRLRVDDGSLRLCGRDETVEVPLSSIANVSPWRLPLPRAGLWLTLRSGRRFPCAIQVSDPVAVVDAMVAAGASHELRERLAHPMVVFARARLAHPAGRLENPLIKFVLYSLVPTIPAFRLHQYITYGGAFGEYYTFGLVPYLVAFGIWWVSWSINLLLFAALIRAVVELLALASAIVLPSRAVVVRRILEVAQRLAYYIGIPTWLLLRLTA